MLQCGKLALLHAQCTMMLLKYLYNAMMQCFDVMLFDDLI